MNSNDSKKRCSWATNDLLTAYHDNEYGKIRMDDNLIFDRLEFELFAQGKYYTEMLEYYSILSNMFFDFDIDKCAGMKDENLDAIVRESKFLNHTLVYNARHNARMIRQVQKDFGTFFKFVYGFKQPERLLSALKKYDFRGIGEENVVWFMRNNGLIEAHEPGCFMKIFPTDNPE